MPRNAMQQAETMGATPFRLVSTADANNTLVKSSPGVVTHIYASNVNAAVRYLKFYDKATTPTAGTDTPVQVFAIPGATTGGITNPNLLAPIEFSTGIAFALVTGAADNNSTGISAAETVVTLGYA